MQSVRYTTTPAAFFITHLIRSGADAAQVSRFAGHSKVSTTLDLYVGEFEKRKVNDSGQRLAEVYAGAV